ncbi:MAG: GTP-binding protein [Verrucomicrobiia bacterium]
MNATLKDSRTLVSEIPGTTRDAVEVPYFRNNRPQQPYLLIDTAGMRQKRHLSDELERQMTARTAHTIQRTDLCLLVIDADRGITEQDKKIAGLIQKAKKPCLIIVNKWDLTRGIKWEDPSLVSQGRAPKKTLTFPEAFQQAIYQQLFFLYDAPIIFVSALEKKGLNQLFAAIDDLIKRSQAPIPTGPLNRTLQKLVQRHPPPLRQGKRFKILYATALNSSAAMKPPTFLGFCNDPHLLLPSWLTFLETHLRKTFHLDGLPLIWQWKSRKSHASVAPQTKKMRKKNERL